MRIIAGEFKGRALKSPNSRKIRPTSSMLRESLFNKLSHGLIEDFTTISVLDLFSGTGALGFEAASRGARKVVCVDQAKEACRLLKMNAETLKLQSDRLEIIRADSSVLGQNTHNSGFDLVFMDPPYGKGLANVALINLLKGNWIAPHAIVVIEEGVKAAVHVPKTMTFIERKTHGVTQIIYLKNTPPASNEAHEPEAV